MAPRFSTRSPLGESSTLVLPAPKERIGQALQDASKDRTGLGLAVLYQMTARRPARATK